MKHENAQDWVTCPTCSGDGWFNFFQPPVICGQCNGQGLVDAQTMNAYQFPESGHAASDHPTVQVPARSEG